MKATNPFMKFSHDIVCLLAVQAFQQGCCQLSFEQFTIKDNVVVGLPFQVSGFILIQWQHPLNQEILVRGHLVWFLFFSGHNFLSVYGGNLEHLVDDSLKVPSPFGACQLGEQVCSGVSLPGYVVHLKAFEVMQSYPARALHRRLQEDWTGDAREGPRVLMSLRVDFWPMG